MRAVKNKVKNDGLIDKRISHLNSSSDIEFIREGMSYAIEKFKFYHAAMMDADSRFHLAKELNIHSLIAEYHEKFMKMAVYVQYYNDESNKLTKIWSDKTGWPSLVSRDEGGIELYIPDENKNPHLKVIK